MNRKRIALLVFVNLDLVAGAFHTEDSAIANVHGVLENTIPHYDPEVVFAPDLLQPNNR